jgi:polysaccharide biosynthesis/export protein
MSNSLMNRQLLVRLATSLAVIASVSQIPARSELTPSEVRPASLAQGINQSRPPLSRFSNQAPADFLQSSDQYQHILGRGDALRLDVFRAPEFSGTVRISSEGTIKLPQVGTMKLSGLTLQQAENRITTQLKTILREPLVTVTMVQARPTRISVQGEVITPGVYTFLPGASSGDGSSLSSNATSTAASLGEPNQLDAATTPREIPSGEPTLIAAIIRAGGIDTDADASQVSVTRSLPNGQRVKQTVNLFTLLRSGLPTDDPYLVDGDVVEIPKAETIKMEDVATLRSSNIAARGIRVNVVGDVVQPGTLELPSDSSLNDAILTSGGFADTAERSRVSLIRQSKDGVVQRIPVKIDYTAEVNSAENPLLKNGDSIIVDRSGWSRFTQGLGVILSPFVPFANTGTNVWRATQNNSNNR